MKLGDCGSISICSGSLAECLTCQSNSAVLMCCQAGLSLQDSIYDIATYRLGVFDKDTSMRIQGILRGILVGTAIFTPCVCALAGSRGQLAQLSRRLHRVLRSLEPQGNLGAFIRTQDLRCVLPCRHLSQIRYEGPSRIRQGMD